jgi:hypothetical protein
LQSHFCNVTALDAATAPDVAAAVIGWAVVLETCVALAASGMAWSCPLDAAGVLKTR